LGDKRKAAVRHSKPSWIYSERELPKLRPAKARKLVIERTRSKRDSIGTSGISVF
jgi:hypothetical protein